MRKEAPMITQFFLPDGNKVILYDTDARKFRGVLLPGSKVQQSNSEHGIITLQQFKSPLFTIGYRILELFTKIKLSVNEGQGLRFEAILNGEVHVSAGGEKVKLKTGQYHLTNIPLFTSLFKKNTACSIFITHYSTELLEQFGLEVLPSSPQKMPEMMANLIQEILHNPYEEKLRDFYYENCVRELLFFHLTQGKRPIPSELENRDIAAIYQADTIIASNLHEHFTIDKLSRMAGTNQFKLKKGFRQLFGMGVFHRLLFLRMEQAKTLLENTKKSIGEIAELAGYDTAAGFIHAFRREFDITPREWRQQVSEKENEDGDSNNFQKK